MPAKETPKVSSAERAQNSYRQLTQAAAKLNDASDGSRDAVSVFDAALKRLNLGVSAWVEVSGNANDDGDWWTRSVGYTRMGNEWGISLKRESGNYSDPERDSVEQWLFNDAPRWMRVEAMGKFVDVFEALTKQAEETTRQLKARTEEALALAKAMSAVLEEPAGQK